MRRFTTMVAPLLLAVTALAGCSDGDAVDQQADPGASPAATAAPSGTLLPSQLVGQWDVAGDGVEPGTVLTLKGDGEALIFRDCGAITGSWSALRGGGFVANAYGGYGDCQVTPATVTPPWLSAATAFAVADDRRELRDTDGRVTVTLSPATVRPKVPRGTIADVVEPPVLTDEERRRLDRLPPAFPAGIRPAAADEIVGTWVLPGETGKGKQNWPAITFNQDRGWVSSDGCNISGGRWALVDGVLLMGSSASTAIGCENISIAGAAVLAGFDGETLVFLDQDGKETRRAERGPAPKPARA